MRVPNLLRRRLRRCRTLLHRLTAAVRSRLGLPDPVDAARVDRFPFVRDGLEGQIVADNLHEHETVALIPAFRCQVCLREVARSQLRGVAECEIGDALLRLDPLVEMFVSAQHDVHAVLQE